MAAVDIVPVVGEMFEQTPGVGEPGCAAGEDPGVRPRMIRRDHRMHELSDPIPRIAR